MRKSMNDNPRRRYELKLYFFSEEEKEKRDLLFVQRNLCATFQNKLLERLYGTDALEMLKAMASASSDDESSYILCVRKEGSDKVFYKYKPPGKERAYDCYEEWRILDKVGALRKEVEGRLYPNSNAVKSLMRTPEKARGPREVKWSEIGHEATMLRNECPEFGQLNSGTAQIIAANLSKARQAMFNLKKRGGRPRFKNARDVSIPFAWNFSGIKVTPGEERRPTRTFRVWLFGIPGYIHARGLLPEDIIQGKLPDGGNCAEANVMYREGHWWLSLCMARTNIVHPKIRRKGTLHIRFGFLEHLAEVNGIAETPSWRERDGRLVFDLHEVFHLQEQIDEEKGRRDKEFPRGKKRTPEQDEALRLANVRIAKLFTRERKVRKNALHVWTAGLVNRGVAKIVVDLPDILANTRTARGDVYRWGAEVKAVAELNRVFRSWGIGMARRMIQYKAEERGILYEERSIAPEEMGIGTKLTEVGQELRVNQRMERRIANVAEKESIRTP